MTEEEPPDLAEREKLMNDANERFMVAAQSRLKPERLSGQKD